MGTAIAAALDPKLATEVYQDICDVIAMYKTRSQSANNSTLLIYEDERLTVTLNGFYRVAEARIATGLDVFHKDDSTRPATKFRPGAWVNYLHTLAERAREQRRQERAAQNEEAAARLTAAYGPVDDADLFGVERVVA